MIARTGAWLRRTWDHDLAWGFRRSPVTIVAAFLTLVCVGGAVFAPWIAPHNPFDSGTLVLTDGFTPPAWIAGGRMQYLLGTCLLYTSPSPRDRTRSRMPSSA